MSKSICFANARIVFPKKVERGDLFVKEGKISAPFANPDITIDCAGKYLTPGLIDLQVNGVEGHDFSTKVVEKPLHNYGVTYYLPTIVSQPLKRYSELIHHSPVPVHVEGPYLNPEFAGAHQSHYLQTKCDLGFWEPLFATSKIKMMTLAPEVEGALDLIELCKKYGVLSACGHSGASFELLLEAKKRGLGLVTHLFNAMQSLHHRRPGIIGAILGGKALPYSLIVDGEHLHPLMAQLCHNAFSEGLILVSDCNAFLGSQATSVTLGGAQIERGALAGSCFSLLDAVRLLHKTTSCPLHTAISAATTRPATLLGLNKGQIKIGYEADLLLLTEELRLSSVYLSGVG